MSDTHNSVLSVNIYGNTVPAGLENHDNNNVQRTSYLFRVGRLLGVEVYTSSQIPPTSFVSKKVGGLWLGMAPDTAATVGGLPDWAICRIISGIISGLPNKTEGMIPWDRIQNVSQRARLEAMPPAMQWAYWLSEDGRVAPMGYVPENVPPCKGVSENLRKQVQILADGEDFTSGGLIEAVAMHIGWFKSGQNLLKIFNKFKASVAEADSISNLYLLHDLLQLLRVYTNPQHWLELALRVPHWDSDLWLAIPAIEAYCANLGRALPRSLAEMRQARVEALVGGYERGAENPAFARICGLNSISEEEFNEYLDFAQTYNSKSVDLIPDLEFEESGYTVRTLDIGDLTGPLLGVLTHCCQHLNGEARGCAVHGWSQPNSRFLVIEKGGEIRAQSWVWLDKKENVIVMDSLEAKSYDTMFPDIVVRIRQEVLNRGYGLALGRTQYGHTKRIIRELVAQFPYAVKTEYQPTNPPDYYDGVRQTLLQ
jgi:hypothetical protein